MHQTSRCLHVICKFYNPEIPGLKHRQSRDSGLRKWAGIPGSRDLGSRDWKPYLRRSPRPKVGWRGGPGLPILLPIDFFVFSIWTRLLSRPQYKFLAMVPLVGDYFTRYAPTVKKFWLRHCDTSWVCGDAGGRL